MQWRRAEVSGGALFLAALLYYIDTEGILLWSGAACTLHELGHYGMIRLCGGDVSALRISCVGAEMTLSAKCPLSLAGQFFAAVAGPLANLLSAVVSVRLAPYWGGQLYLFAGINLALAAFNLLPIAQLDGGRALKSLLALLWPEEMAARLVRICSSAVSVALVLGGAVLVWEGRASVTLLFTALWLFAATIQAAIRRKGVVFS